MYVYTYTHICMTPRRATHMQHASCLPTPCGAYVLQPAVVTTRSRLTHTLHVVTKHTIVSARATNPPLAPAPVACQCQSMNHI